MRAVFIIAFSVLSAIVYGIVHDLITTRICLEYFTVGHPPIFGGTHSPTLLAFGWGVIATWWVGLPLGILLALAARVGELPKLEVRDLLWPMAVGLCMMLALAMVAGYFAYANVDLSILPREPAARDMRRRFAFDLGAHTASYELGVILGIVLCIWTIMMRVRRNRPDTRRLADAWANR